MLGETLSRNVERMRKQKPHLNETEAVTSAVAESFTAIVDDMLVAYGASQILIAQDTIPNVAHGLVEAVQLGQPFYQKSVLMLNFLIILTVVFEIARTRGWEKLPRFNVFDIKSVIVATSEGGNGIAETVYARHRSQGSHWNGNTTDASVGETAVKLDLRSTIARGETTAIVKAEDLNPMSTRFRGRHVHGLPIEMERLRSESNAPGQRSKAE